MTELDDIDALAAEYVLGTLSHDERVAAQQRFATEPALKSAVVAWQRRLSPLADTVAPVAPPANLYNKIRAQIGLSAHVISLKAREQQLMQLKTARLIEPEKTEGEILPSDKFSSTAGSVYSKRSVR